jgi:hypothetical protein
VLSEIREIKAVIMSGKESSLTSIRALPFVASANFDQLKGDYLGQLDHTMFIPARSVSSGD